MTPESFWGNVDRTGDCWIWLLSKGHNGYGVVGTASGSTSAHRMAYELAYGPIPSTQQVHHACKRRDCVRPEHLHAMSVSEHWERHVAMGIKRTKRVTPKVKVAIQRELLKCKRCDHTWVRRSETLPRTCPNRKCHSPFWQTVRKAAAKKRKAK